MLTLIHSIAMTHAIALRPFGVKSEPAKLSQSRICEYKNQEWKLHGSRKRIVVPHANARYNDHYDQKLEFEEDKSRAIAAATSIASAVIFWASSSSAMDVCMNTCGDHSMHNEIFQLAEGEEFWSNVLRYISYFFSVLFGTVFVALQPIFKAMTKNIWSALAVISLFTGVLVGLSLVLRAMLGFQ